MKRIYLDHAATTPVAKEVMEAMLPFFNERFGNASSLHHFGREAREALEDSRKTILKKLNGKNHTLVFTSGGTESNNLAIKGVAFANRNKGKHIITTKIEHDCVLNTCKWLESMGFEITYLPVDKYGFVNPEDVESSIRDDTILVSVIHANNEIGTIEPISEIGKICEEKDVYFHTDACQSFTKVPINLKKQHIDLLTINSHKIYGPKGIGALILGENVDIEPIAHGGGHEFGLRSGTENVAGAVGFAKATEIIKDKDIEHMKSLRDMLIKGALEIEETWLNGHPTERLCNNANITFRYIEGESLLLHLDLKGIAVSTGSACSSKSLEPSHVLMAIGLRPEDAHGSIRFSLGKDNTKDEIKYTLEVLKESVEILRKISPFKPRR
ncbi:MAG: cysteine desulfurase NifS [Candidatus Aenigmatarchaeota archaeon]|nr:MAG: cysteine desulfurase NifS [Candidatus Aenigmarchaeota archaeon]